MSTLGKWVFGTNGCVETGTNGCLRYDEHFGANGHYRTDELWAKWALGANGHLGKMGTRKNEHQGK